MALTTRGVSESFGFRATEGHTYVFNGIRTRRLSNSIAVAATPTPIIGAVVRTARLSQTVTIGSNVRRTVRTSRSSSLAVAFTEAIRIAAFYKPFRWASDGVSVSSSIRAVKVDAADQYLRRLSDGTSFSDSVFAAKGGTLNLRRLSDIADISDAVFALKAAGFTTRYLSAAVSISSQPLRRWTGARSLEATLSATDVGPPPPFGTSAGSLVWSRVFFAGVHSVAFPTRFFILPRIPIGSVPGILSASVAVSSDLYRVWSTVRDSGPAVAISDSVSAALGGQQHAPAGSIAWPRTFFLGMNPFPAFPFRFFLLPRFASVGFSVQRSISEDIEMSVPLATETEYWRWKMDVFDIAEAIVKEGAFDRSGGGSVTVDDEENVFRLYNREDEEELRLDAMVERSRYLLRGTSDDVGMVDAIIEEYVRLAARPGSIFKVHSEGLFASSILDAVTFYRATRQAKMNVVRVPGGDDVIQTAAVGQPMEELQGLVLGDDEDRDAIDAALSGYESSDRLTEILFFVNYVLKEKFMGRVEGHSIQRLRPGIYLVRMSVLRQQP